MRVTKVDGVYKASRITGPKHNFLGLVLSTTAPLDTALVQCPIKGELPVIDEVQLVAAVLAGVEQSNRTRSAALYAHSIEYVPSDTPDYETYSLLAKTITEAAAAEI